MILIFWNKFAQKGYFRSKTGQLNIITEFSVFELVKITSSTLSRDNFDVLDQICPKRTCPVQKQEK